MRVSDTVGADELRASRPSALNRGLGESDSLGCITYSVTCFPCVNPCASITQTLLPTIHLENTVDNVA